MISVILATKNRSQALKIHSLPTLLKQFSQNFEVIVWDASDTDASEKICTAYKIDFENRGTHLHYHKAKRPGSASQRNDAVKATRGEIIFFMDDDCEISCDGIEILQKYFDSFSWLVGAGLPMLNKVPAKKKSFIAFIVMRLFWMRNTQFKRLISPSGSLSLPIIDLAGEAQWLSGGSMAYRKTVFDFIHFDERLERFGGYAMGEDYDFSHRVFLHFKQPLLITNGGYVVHCPETGERATPSDYVAATYYNRRIIKENFKNHNKKISSLAYLWGGIGATILLLSKRISLFTLYKGIKDARRARKNDGSR